MKMFPETTGTCRSRAVSNCRSLYHLCPALSKPSLFQYEMSLTQSQVDWLSRHRNVLITGPCGTGKSYLACASGHMACLKGYSVRYYRTSRLLEELTLTNGDGSYSKQLKQLAKTDLLILDDWGLEPLTQQHRNDLLEAMDDRHENGSTIVTSQLPTKQWHGSINDETLADAILDRLMHNATMPQCHNATMPTV